MENREGYKKTELGWIPDEWRVVKIGTFTMPVSEKNTAGEITDVVSVTKYNGIVSSLDYFNKQVYSENIKTYKVIYRDQFAYATIHLDEGSIGYLNCYDKAVLSPMYTVFSLNNSLADKHFIFSLLKSDKLMNIYNHIGSGSINRRKSISYSVFSQICIPLPPLPEQQKIASILTTVDDKISSIEAQIQQTEQLKQGLMAKLLTEGIGHTEFKDTEIGRIPKGWDVVALGRISNNFDNKRIPIKSEDRQHLHGLYPYYGAQGIIDRINDFIFDGKYLLVAEDGENVKSRNNDIAFVVKGKFWVNNHAHILQPNDMSNIYFLKFVLNFISIKEYVTGMAQPKLNKSQLDSILIQLPPLPEQQQIASILSSVDDKIDILQSKKSAYTTLKKGLMAKLLTGQMRVKI